MTKENRTQLAPDETAPAVVRTRRRRWRRLLGLLLTLFVVVIGALPLAVPTRPGTWVVEQAMAMALGQPVHTGRVEAGYWRPYLRIHDLRVGDLLTADFLEIDLTIEGMRHRRLDGVIRVRGLEVSVERLLQLLRAPDAATPGELWLPGNLRVEMAARSPEFSLTATHGSSGFHLDADVAQANQVGLPWQRFEGMRVSAAFDSGSPASDDPSRWTASLSVDPLPGRTGTFTALGHELVDLALTVELASGVLDVRRASATIDGQPLRHGQMQLEGDHLSFDLGAGSHFELNADLRGVPDLKELIVWAATAKAPEPRALLAGLTGTVAMAISEQPLAGHRLTNVEVRAVAGDGRLSIEQLSGAFDGMKFAGQATVDLTTEPPQATYAISSDATLALEQMTGITAGGLHLEGGLTGIPGWTPTDGLSARGRLSVAQVRILAAAVDDLTAEFEVSGGKLRLSQVSARTMDGGALGGEVELDLATPLATLRGRLNATNVPLPLLGTVDLTAEVTHTGEGMLVFEPIRAVIVASRARGAEEVITGSASVQVMGDSLPFSLRCERLTLSPDLPPLEGLAAQGALDSSAARSGRAKLRIDSWPLPGWPVTDLVAEIAFDSSGLRADQLQARLDGSALSAQGSLTWLPPGAAALSAGAEAPPWSAAGDITLAELHVIGDPATVVLLEVGLRAEVTALRPPASNGDISLAHVEAGSLHLTAATLTVGGVTVESVDAVAKIARGTLEVAGASARHADEPLTADVTIDLDNPELPATFTASLARLVLEQAQHPPLEIAALRARGRVGSLVALANLDDAAGDAVVEAESVVAGELRMDQVQAPLALAAGKLSLQRASCIYRGGPATVSGEIDITTAELPAVLAVEVTSFATHGVTAAGARLTLETPALKWLDQPELAVAKGTLQAQSLTSGGSTITDVGGAYALAGGKLSMRGATFRRNGQPGTADLEADLRTQPVSATSTVRVARLPLGGYDATDVEIMLALEDDVIDVRSLAARWGEFTVRGGGRFGRGPRAQPGAPPPPTGAPPAAAGLMWMDATLALEHPRLRGVTAKARLDGLDTDGAAQPELRGAIDLSAREADVLGDTLTELRVTAMAERGVFTTDQLSASWGVGRLTGTGSFDTSAATPTYKLRVRAAQLPVNTGMGRPLGFVLPFFSGAESSVTGSLDATVDLQGRGLTRADLDRHLTGSGSASIADGRISGSPILGVTQGWHGVVGETRVTADAGFLVRDGKVSTNRPLTVRSEQDLLTMTGWVDFDRRIAYDGEVRALGAGLLPEFDAITGIISRDGFLPFRLTGTVDSPTFELDADRMMQRTVENLLDPRLWQKLLGGDK